MYSKDGIVYSDGFKYLKHKTKSIVGFAVPGSEEDFEEKNVDLSTLEENGDFITLNGCLRIIVPEKTHKAIKTKVVKARYSNDDQIAIMLNEDTDSTERMQKWREFAEKIADKVCGE